MPEDKPDKTPSHGKPERPVGDAGLLFRDAAPAGSSGARSQPAAAPGEEFALVDIPESAPEEPPALPRGAQPKGAAAAEPRGEGRATRSSEDSGFDPSDLVPEPWSRWAEWGMNLIILGAWLMLIILLAYIVSGMEFYWLAFVLLIVGGLVAVVLSYPLIITLERPVRVTPEQALRDYYNALSHHVPHFRRMWLLLSAAGRVSSAFGSFEGFKGYWKEQLGRLRQGHAGPLTPLVFEVINFKAEKSAGKSRIDVTYSLNVSVRGQRSSGAIHTIPAALALVRGPDNMWYLENGTLARAERTTRSRSLS